MKQIPLQPLLIALLLNTGAAAQVIQNDFFLQQDASVVISESQAPFNLGWAGGLNSGQYSNIDFNLDGIMDVLIFDRCGNVTVPLISDGSSGTSGFVHAPEYAQVWPFPEIRDWVLAKDYNCDGKADLFASTVGGIKVYRNISTNNSLQFELVTINPAFLASNYVPVTTNIFVTSADIPAIHDVDNDGDLDILTFSIFGTTIDYHKNQSVEQGFGCDSLIYEVRSRCWGYFSENLNNNSVTLNDTCVNNVPNNEFNPNENPPEGLRHVGSTVTALDLDGDTVTDLLLGDISYANVLALYNDGTLNHAHIGSQDSTFPAYDVPINIPYFPATFYVDVTNDGKRDLIAAPNKCNLAENFESNWFYENIGTDQHPDFNFIKKNLFQDEMVDLGTGAYPVPFDYNGDAAMDLLVGNFGYYAPGSFPSQLALFENVGTSSNPTFELIDRDFGNISADSLGASLIPAVGDVDGDGDQDVYVGDVSGRIHFYENNPVGGLSSISLSTLQVPDNGGTAIDVGQFSAPQLFDVNGDGLLDLLIGERNGNINYYQNLGSASAPDWFAVNDSIGDVTVTEYWNVVGRSVPCMFLNAQGERELIVGSEYGGLFFYDNIEGNLQGTWNKVDSIFQGIKEGIRTGVCVYDFTGDSLLDVIVGNERGGLSFWRNDLTASVTQTIFEEDQLRVYPNPSNGEFRVSTGGQRLNGAELIVYDSYGKIIIHRKVSGSQDLLVNTTSWSAGAYMVQLRNAQESKNGRVMILGR